LSQVEYSAAAAKCPQAVTWLAVRGNNNQEESILKKKGKVFAVLFTFLMVMGIFRSLPVLADDDVKPKSVTIQKSSMTVSQGKTFKIKAKTKPGNADDDYLRWEIVSGKKYVEFDDDDRNDDEIKMMAVKPGKAKIRCYVKGKDKDKYGDVITVTVEKGKEDYTLSRVGKETRTVEVGDDFELKVKCGSSIKKSKLKWKIANTKIVGFDDDDKKGNKVEFKAKKVGTTEITCTCTDKKAKTKNITFKIKVIKDDDDNDDDNDDSDDDDDDDDDDKDDDD